MYLNNRTPNYNRNHPGALVLLVRWLILLAVVAIVALVVFVVVRYPKVPAPQVYQNIAQVQSTQGTPAEQYTRQMLTLMDQTPLAVTAGLTPPTFDATGWILVDVTSGQVLAGDNINQHIPPASLTKLMTVSLVFKALQAGKLTKEQQVTVSKKAWRTGGSRMFIRVGTQVSIDDLIQGLVVQSGNDAAVQLAESVAGNTDSFVALMNQQAADWGLKDSHFSDVNGLPTPNHYSSVKDIAMIAQHIIHDWPQYYSYFGEGSFTYNNIKQLNRNGLVRRNVGVDGLKTGHTQAAGYCLVASAFRNGRRLLTVVVGTKSSRARESISLDLLNWGYNNFSDKAVLTKGQVLTSLPVHYGVQHTLNAGVASDVVLTVPVAAQDAVKVNLHYNTQLQAPIKKGDIIGSVDVVVGGNVVRTLPLISLDNVTRAGALSRFWTNVKAAF